ncbi:MAG: hypothetical protein QF823_03225 [Candidatus Marinimicrobia bacterium]|jgi:hypothetical protein|nr:hypothetical protein [Candidatus Neomarinimicrobiota bacterium]
MKLKLYKPLCLLLTGIIVFSACEDKDDSPNLGDSVGLWQLTGLTGTYTREVITKDGVAHSADAYPLVANWKDAAGFAAAAGVDEALVVGATNQTLAAFTAGDNAPGFPRTAVFDAAALAAVGISMQVDLLDSKSKSTPGTYTVKGTYPSLRLDETICNTYLMIPPPQINDTGDWTCNYETGVFTLSPVVDIEQVLPPFPDGIFAVNRDVEPATFSLDFLDRDAHDVLYSQVKSAWDETEDRTVSGLAGLPVNAGGGWDPTATTDPTSEAYIMSAALASWGGYLTWYAFNISAEAVAKVADVKNPLTDLDGDGTINAVDMIVYMHMDNLASGGGKTAFGLPYALLVDSSNPAAPAPVNDSANDWSLAGLATGGGGKMKYVITMGVCMPVNETIKFESSWTEVAQ